MNHSYIGNVWEGPKLCGVEDGVIQGVPDSQCVVDLYYVQGSYSIKGQGKPE